MCLQSLLKLVGASVLALLIPFSSSSKALPVSILFEELANEGGIVISATDNSGNFFQTGVIPGEFASVGCRLCGIHDLTLQGIGSLRITTDPPRPFGFLVTEVGGGPSDLVVVGGGEWRSCELL
jgi:hypothetical protein